MFVKDRMCIEGGVEQMLTKDDEGGRGVSQKMTYLGLTCIGEDAANFQII